MRNTTSISKNTVKSDSSEPSLGLGHLSSKAIDSHKSLLICSGNYPTIMQDKKTTRRKPLQGKKDKPKRNIK